MNQIQIPAEPTKEKLFREFDTVVAETEQLIRTAAGAGSEKAGALKASLEQEFSAASERLVRIRDDAVAQCSAMAKTTDAYVQGNPWRSVGIVATFAVAAGLIAGLIISRR
jgi:ElaB/YqjD/DUF883 family membrane-anchored ribosome-binding protein